MLTVRNEASRTLRRVARDVGRLDDITRLRTQAQGLQNATNRLKTQRDTAASELQSLTTGKKRLDLEQKILAQQNLQKKAQLALKNANLLQNRNYQQQVSTIRQLEAVERGLASKKLSDFKRQQLEYRKEELLTQQTRLGTQQKLIPAQRGVATRNITQAKQALSALAIAETEMGNKAVFAQDKLSNLDDQIDLNNHKLRQMNDEISNMRWGRLENAGRIVAHIGAVLATVGAVGTIALGTMAKSAAEFSKQITLAATQARLPGQSFAATAGIAKNLTKTVLDQMQQFPASSEEMANSLYEIFSSTNISSQRKAADTLKLFNQMAVAGGSDLGTMTDAGITLLNNFVGPGENQFKTLKGAVDFFFATVKEGRFTAEQFATSLGNVVSIAGGAGLSLKDVGTAMAFITKQTGATLTKRDATGLARLIEMFERADVIKGLHDAGVEVERVGGGMRPLLDVMKDIKSTFKLKPGAETLNFFKTISAAGSGGAGTAGTSQGRRIFNIMYKDLAQYEKTQKTVFKTQGEFMKSFKALSKTPGVRWDVTVNQMKALAIMVGQEVIPILTQLAWPLIKLLHWFNALNPSTKHWIAVLLTLGSVSALVVGGLAAMVSSLVVLIFTFKIFARQIGLLDKLKTVIKAISFRNLNTEAGEISTKFGLIGGAVAAALIVLPLFHNQITQLITGAQGLSGAFKVLEIVLTAMTIKSIAGLTARLLVARGAVGSLFLVLARLASMRLITITVAVVLSKKSMDLGKKLSKWVGGTLFGDSSSGWMIPGHSANDIARKNAIQKIKDMEAKDLKDILNRTHTTIDPVTGKTSQFVQPTKQDKARLDTLAGMKNLRRIQKMEADDLKRLMPKYYAGWLKELKNVDRLRQAFERTPTKETWIAYHKAMDALTAKSTEQQKAMINDLLGSFGEISILTNAQFTAAYAKLQVLQKAAENSTDPAVIAKYLKAQDVLTSKSTSNQIQAADEAAANAKRLHQEGLDRAKEAADKAKQLADEAAADAKARLDQGKSDLKSAVSTIMGIYQQAQQQNQQALGTLFAGPFMSSAVVQNRTQHGFGIRKSDIMRDIFAQVNQFKTFQTSLNQLTKRGAPQELVSQLQAMGPEAQKQISLILSFSDSEFKKYTKEFQAGQTAVAQASRRDLNKEIKKWRSFGAGVAKAIALGITDQNAALEKSMQALILKLFPGLGKAAGIKTPDAPITKAVADHVQRMFKLPGNNPGLLQTGNIDLLHRQVAHVGNQIATVKSLSIGTDIGEVLIPSVIDGIIRSKQYAIDYYKKTHQNLGVFSSPAAANAYADRLHQQQAGYYGNKPGNTNTDNTKSMNVNFNGPVGDHVEVKKMLKDVYFDFRNQFF